MAERNNKLILPDFFGSKGGLTTPSSIVNTTDPLQPGETIFEKDTGQFKTNLSSSTLPYSQSGYTGNAIRFSNLTELRGYDYPFDYQLVHTISPKTFFYYDPVDTSSPDDGTTVIVSNNGKRFKSFSPLASLPDNYYVSGSLIVSESVTTTETIEKNNVKYWGAVGDGVTDDTVAIQNCVDYVSSSGGGIVYVPSTPNYYKTMEPINLKYKTIVEGDGESSWIFNQSTRSLAEGIAFTSRPFTMGTMNQTFYLRVSRSAYLPITASDDYVELDPQEYSAPSDWYNVNDIILIRNGEGEIGSGSFAGSSFAELRRIVSKDGNKLFVDVPFLESVSPISSSATASDANTIPNSSPWNQFIKGPGYSFITKMTPGFLGRDNFSASLFIADEIGLRNLKLSSLSGSFMGDGAAYKPLFENLYFEDCNQGMIVNGYAFGTLRNIKGRKFAGRALESAEGCHDNLFENLDLVRGGRPEVVSNEKSVTDVLIALRERDKLVNSKIYAPINSASINVSSPTDPNYDVLPIAGFVITEGGVTIENCEIGGVGDGGSMVTIRGSDVKILNNKFISYNDSTIFPNGIEMAQSIAINNTRGSYKNITISGNIFEHGDVETSIRLIYIYGDDVGGDVLHENINIQNNIFYVKDPNVKRIFLEASSSVFANNIIFSEGNTPIDFSPNTPLFNPSIYNNVYYNTSLGKMMVQNDSLQVFNSDVNFSNLPTSDPGITGRLFQTSSEAIGGSAGYNLVLISP